MWILSRNMAILPIVKEPQPILHSRATAVTQVTPQILSFIEAMIETMHGAQGVGLAANQVGSPWDILVASPDGEKGREIALINARIVSRAGREVSAEGCLSLPGISAEVARSAQITVKGLDRLGHEVAVEAEGLLAKILQHETDHLNGHLFLDRLRFFESRRLGQEYQRLCRTLGRVNL